MFTKQLKKVHHQHVHPLLSDDDAHASSTGVGRCSRRDKPLVIVGTYTKHNNLAHAPRGTEANYGIYTFELDPNTGCLTLLSVLGEEQSKGCMNPAYFAYHPTKNIVYACTESIYENGLVAAYKVDTETGSLREISCADAGGTSTCYLEFDDPVKPKNMLLVNYWNSTIGTMPVDEAGNVKPLTHLLKSPVQMVAKVQSDHLKQRQSEPHTHAVVFEPWSRKIAYVPDLGMDKVRQYLYDHNTGKLTLAGYISAGDDSLKPHGPRYIELCEKTHTAYLINELSSTVSVYSFDAEAATKVVNGESVPTLHFIQSVSCIPEGFPRQLNTCGRITIHPTERYVLVSNRGHDSICIFRVNEVGYLSRTTIFHTGGQTPRHFNFDPSGQFIIIANQDTDTLSVLNFNQSSGQPNFLHSYPVPSPNFVCVNQTHPTACNIHPRL